MNVKAPMAVEVLIGIPRDILHTTRMSPVEMKRELALTLFQQGKISFGKARKLAGMTVWAFQQLLGSREIPVHYDEAGRRARTQSATEPASRCGRFSHVI